MSSDRIPRDPFVERTPRRSASAVSSGWPYRLPLPGLSWRESWRKDAEILMLPHQFAVAK